MHSLLGLEPDTINLVLKCLDPTSLARVLCVCKTLKQLACDESLWQSQCKARWQHVNCRLEGSAAQACIQQGPAAKDAPTSPCSATESTPPGSWRGLYSSKNRWRWPRFATQRFSLPPLTAAVDAMAVCSADNISPQGSPSEDVVLLSATSGERGEFLQVCKVLLPGRLQEQDRNWYKSQDGASCLLPMGNATLATGTSAGDIQIFQLHTDKLAMMAESRGPQGGPMLPVVEMHYSSSKGRIYALNNASGTINERSQLRCYDVTRNVILGEPVHELFRDYELTTFCLSPREDGGNQLIAGAVRSGCCRECEMTPSLCYHKSHAHVAAVCMFDLRSSVTMVQRHTLHHRSLYPTMQGAKEHYVFTSHAGSPLCAWDIRNMSTFVWEEHRLGHYSERPEVFNGLPLGDKKPDRWPEHQGLHLTTDGDTLVGRAENGMMWAWDLSATLGWEAPWAGQRGSWLQQYPDDVPREPEFKDWPTPLGVWTLDGPIPRGTAPTVLRNGRPAVLVGVCSDFEARTESCTSEYVSYAQFA